MNYNKAYNDLTEVRMVWRVSVPNERYQGKVLRKFEELMQPAKTSYYKNSFPRFDGYQFDLLSLTIDHGEASLSSSYPDW